MSFLPADYESPKPNGLFLKLETGENRIRILSAPIIGWEDWKDNKPVRYRRNMKPEQSFDPKKPMRHFWALIIWNYKQNKIQVLEITQSSIIKRIEALSKDADWGSPFNYDIKITKSGQAVETEYTVNPLPHRELDPYIKEEFYKLPIDLEEMFRGGDPAVVSGGYRTLGFWEGSQEKKSSQLPPTEDVISEDQAKMLEEIVAQKITPKDAAWINQIFKVLNIKSFKEMKKVFFETMFDRINQKAQLLALEEEIPF